MLFLENSLLDQVSAIYSGLIFPVWIEGRMLVRVKATLSGRNVCELLARDSEVDLRHVYENMEVLRRNRICESIMSKRACYREKYFKPQSTTIL